MRRGLTVAAAAAVLSLAACSDPGGGAPAGAGAAPSLPDRLAVAGGAVVVAGPAGYCVDRRGSRTRGDTAFVLLASCASVASNADVYAPSDPGLLTASVDHAAGDVPGADTLMAFMTSAQGRGALARDGAADAVEILEARQWQGAVLLRISDQSANPIPGLEGTYWRGLFSVRDRLVTVTVIGFEARGLSTDAGLAKLQVFIERIRQETRAVKADAPVVPVATDAQETAEPRKSFFRKLLR